MSVKLSLLFIVTTDGIVWYRDIQYIYIYDCITIVINTYIQMYQI
jgi:hypothetical protein